VRRLLTATALALCLSTALYAASYTKFEAITVAATSIGFTAANINNLTGLHPSATQATCRLELAEIRYTIDRTTPSATVGVLLEIGDVLTLIGNDTLNDVRFFRTTAVSGQLDCHYAGTF
jgi:hypothetical protein